MTYRPIIDDLTALRARVSELEEEIRASRKIAALEAEDDARAVIASRIKAATRMRGVAAPRMTAALYLARRPLTTDHLCELIPPQKTQERYDSIVYVWACHVREALGRDALQTHRELGYSLTSAGRARIEEILK
jgi:hypothetical protein